MNTHVISRLISVTLFSLLFTNAALAKPCKADIKKFCAEHRGDRAQVMSCLLDHKDQVSDQCKARIGKKLNKPKNKRKARKLKRACQADIQTHCQSVGKGRGEVLKCLKDHRKDLKPQCKKRIRKLVRRMRRKSARRACRVDAKTHCADVKPGGGRIKECLKANMDKLSPGCQSRFKNKPSAATEGSESTEDFEHFEDAEESVGEENADDLEAEITE